MILIAKHNPKYTEMEVPTQWKDISQTVSLRPGHQLKALIDVLGGRIAGEHIEILERLGGGHFGEVYRGRWRGTTDVALKRLKSSQHLEKFLQEVMMLRSLSHPNIVQFLGVYVDTKHGDDHYITTDCAGPLHVFMLFEISKFIQCVCHYFTFSHFHLLTR